MKEYKTGTFIIGKYTVVVTKTIQGNWQMVIACEGSAPNQKDVAKVRYKYLPDNIIMARIFPSFKEYKSIPDNINILIQIIN